jgi:outer membrane lipase/esterase
MLIDRRRWARAFACVSSISFAAMATPVEAQQIDRIVVFGDSYADIGNALRLAGINPATTGVYTTGRFSGGTNYIDTLSTLLQVPQYNFAIGGARTNNGNQTAGLPGFTFEVQEFLAGGGTLGFPTVNTTLDRTDLVAVSIGGNDARAYQQGSGTLAGAPVAAATAVTNFQQNFDLVMQRGTPTISFLAGDTGRLPEIATNPAGAAVRTAYSTAFNGGVQNVLAGYAGRGSIVHYLDLSKVLDQVGANPTAYGITNGLVCPLFPANTTCAANASGYLFYGDALHLTSQGFAIVGQYVARQLAAPLTLQGPSDLGVDTARQWARTLSSRSDLYGRDANAEGFRMYIVGDGLSHDLPNSSQTTAAQVRSGGGTVGAEYGMSGGIIGIAANYSRPQLRFNDDSSRIKDRSWQLGAYGSFGAEGFFGQGYVGYGEDRDRIARKGVVTGMTAQPHGTHIVGGIKGGYLIGFGGLQAGPVIALDYARAKVDAYTESGDPALTLNVSSQSLKDLSGQAGIEVRGTLAGLHPFVDLTAEHNFASNDRLISFAQTSAPVIVNHWAMSRGKDTYGRISGGASAYFNNALSLDVAMSSTVGRDGGAETSAQLGLKARF